MSAEFVYENRHTYIYTRKRIIKIENMHIYIYMRKHSGKIFRERKSEFRCKKKKKKIESACPSCVRTRIIKL